MKTDSAKNLPIGRAAPPPKSAARRNPREILRFGDRLGSELAALVACIPTNHLSASGMSRWLAINRGTCQRVLLAARAVGDSREVLRKAPGVEGLEEFVRVLATRIGRREEIDRAEALVQDYALLVQRTGGSQAKLVRLALSAESDSPAPVSAAAAETSPRENELTLARRSIYEASRVTTGAWASGNIGLQVFCPSVQMPGFLDAAFARGWTGLRRRADGLALSSRLSGFVEKHEMLTLEGEKGPGKQWSALIAEFCTTPLPTVISHPEGGTVTYIVLGDNAVDREVDVILGGRGIGPNKDPRTGAISHLTATYGIRFPSRAQIYDLYLHRDLAEGARVFTNALAVSPAGADPVQAWFDKLAYAPSLRAMGPGLIEEPPPIYPRMRELADHVFSKAGWNPADFEAWRIELAYPSPGVAYTITVYPPAAPEQP